MLMTDVTCLDRKVYIESRYSQRAHANHVVQQQTNWSFVLLYIFPLWLYHVSKLYIPHLSDRNNIIQIG